MLLSSFTGRAVTVCPRNLAKRAKGNSASLRHVIVRVELAGHRPATRVQSTNPLSAKRTHQTIVSEGSLKIMSDDAYSSFLDQANQDTGASKVSTKSKSAATKAVDTDVPVTLQKVDQYYTSESDEPFEPVSLKWSGENMPSESMQPQRAPSLRPERRGFYANNETLKTSLGN